MQADQPELHPLAQAVVDAHETIAPKITADKRAHLVEMLETFEQDIYPLVAPFVQGVIDDPSTPDHVRGILAPLTDPQHFGESVVIGIAVGSILSPVLQAALDPLLVELAKGAWRTALASGSPTGGVPLTGDLLAAAVLKGVLDEGNAAGQAAQSGHTPTAFHTMVQTAGNAIGFEQALELERRGLLAGTTLDAVLHYSNVNPAFYAAAKNLITNPVSIGEILNARIREHLTDAQAQDLYRQAGGIPAEYAWRRDSVGRPPGPMQVGELFNRRIIDDGTASAMLAQSDLALAFQDTVKELWKYYPPPRSLVPMLRAKAIDEAKFRLWMSYYGAPPDVVDAFIKEATHTTSTAGKDLTQAQVTRLYGAEILTRAEATTRLDALGLPAADVTLLLDYEDNLRPEKLMNALIAKIGGRYVAHKMTKPEATTSLAAGKVPAAATQQLFAIWDIERTANTYSPTPAGIVGALRRGLITPAAAHRRLNNLGVLDADIVIVVGDGWPPTAPQDAKAAVTAVLNDDAEVLSTATGSKAPHKTLTPSQITKEYLSAFITRPQALTALEALGYNATDANALLTLAGDPVVPAP